MRRQRQLLNYLGFILLSFTCIESRADVLQISYPLDSSAISSSFGLRNHPVRAEVRHHDGVDLPAKYGAPIQAVGPGRVIYSGRLGAYGRLVVIAHTDSLTSHYGHCSSISVQVGQLVQTGQVIGAVGSSGLSTGPHLHFEVRKNGNAVNPELFFPALGEKADG